MDKISDLDEKFLNSCSSDSGRKSEITMSAVINYQTVKLQMIDDLR